MYSREIEDSVLTLSASGWTYNDTFVLYDIETESLWYHLNGERGLRCISGHYADEVLDEFTVFFGRWDEWVLNNPNTKILDYP